MSTVGLVIRVTVLVLAFLVVLPALTLGRALRRDGAEALPVLYHRLFAWLFGLRVRVSGPPPEAGVPTLVLANHVSWLDIPVMAGAMPLSFIAKSEIAGWPVFGFLARVQRCIFLDRSRKGATAEVNALVAERLGRGDVIVLFPEGTTSDGNRLLPFRSSLVGAARAALAGGDVDAIRLQPLAIAYARRSGLPLTRRERPDVAWYGDMDLLPHLVACLRGGPIDAVLTWGEPILFAAASDRKRAAVAAERAVREALRTRS